jgi:hypothetical protein
MMQMTSLTTTNPDNKVAHFGPATVIDEPAVSARDLLISKLLVAQPTSKFVRDEKAKLGEIRESLEAKLVAGKGQTGEIIVFNPFKTRVTFKIVKKNANDPGKREYAGQVPWTPAFEVEKPKMGQWMEKLSGEDFVHYETINYYVLLPNEIADGESFPYLASFQSTGYQAGKVLESRRLRLQMSDTKIYSQVFHIASEQRENDKGTFYVPVITTGRKATDAEYADAKKWVDMIRGANVTIDHSDLESVDVDVAQPAVNYDGMNKNF